eukprot:CAMPEP_0172901282 /NCGR_PEP_ID=MMETSP1075-20121228/165939_1 /TAXON_ID=2916 /ORGANISM="Ceratium fusus, Strain PA161109" /LENGTH=488 /DNA_ID=CAMNT_0013757643 /DNA_START=93 /DNA_END=1560 /DNA_ORIENTATION=+
MQLQHLEERVQQLVAENARLRATCRGGHTSRPHQDGEEVRTPQHGFDQDAMVTLLVPPPERQQVLDSPAHAVTDWRQEEEPTAVPLPPLVLTPEDVDAMLHNGQEEASIAPEAQIRWKPAFEPGCAKGHFPDLPAQAPVALRLASSAEGMGREQQRRFIHEVRMLSNLHHPHIVPLLAYCVPRLALVHPWPEKGCLGQLLRSAPLDPLEGFQALFGAAQGVVALHDLHLVHRNIRSDGIYLYADSGGDDILSKLGDCGMLCDMNEQSSTANGLEAARPPYADPWYLISGRVSTASDIFSLGVVVLEVLLGRSAAQLAEPGVSADKQLRAGPQEIASPDAELSIAQTRRPRPRPLWQQFDQQVPRGPEAAKAAAELVFSTRPRPDWSKRALAIVSGLALEMLRLNEGAASSEPPERPTAVFVAEQLEEQRFCSASAQLCPGLDSHENGYARFAWMHALTPNSHPAGIPFAVRGVQQSLWVVKHAAQSAV